MFVNRFRECGGLHYKSYMELYALWFVIFEDDTFMPIMCLPEKMTQDQLVNDYDTHFGIHVDIETSDIQVTGKNMGYLKCLIGRVYPPTASLSVLKDCSIPAILTSMELEK